MRTVAALQPLLLLLSILGSVSADDVSIDNSVNGATVSGGQDINMGTTVYQSGNSDVTGTPGADNTAGGAAGGSTSNSGANSAHGATFVHDAWLVVGAGVGIVAGGLGVLL